MPIKKTAPITQYQNKWFMWVIPNGQVSKLVHFLFIFKSTIGISCRNLIFMEQKYPKRTRVLEEY